MTYGVEALTLLREEVEDCPPTKAELVLIDEFCELNDKNYHFVCYVKIYFTTEEIIVARRKTWNAQMPAYTFSRVHKISDIVLKKEHYLTDVIKIEDTSKDQAYYYQIHFSGELKVWVSAYERYSQWHQNKKSKQSATTSVAATSNCNEAKMVSGSRDSSVTSNVLWNRADCQFLNPSARSNSISSSQDLSSHLVTPVRNNRRSNPFCQDYTVLNWEEDVPSSPEPQESSGFDLDNVSINEEGETSEEQAESTFSTALEAWTPSNDDFVTTSSDSNEVQVIPDDDMIRTLDTAVCNKGHSRNKSTSLTRGVQIVTRSESIISKAMSDPGAEPGADSRMTVQAGLAYANLPAVLKSLSCDHRSNSFLSSPLRHTQIRGKKVKFSPRQRTFSTALAEDGSEQCLVYENDTQDDSYCSLTPENSTPSDNNEDITPRPLTPTRSVPITKQEKGATIAGHGSALTLPKRKLVSKLFRRRTTSSISDIDDSHTDMDTPETPRLFKKKIYQLDSKMLAAQLVLLDAEMLRKIKPDELKGGAWVGKNKETRAPNVMKMVKEFNRLALLVPTEILEEKTPSGRAKVIACYIQIADKCRNFGNYNSLKAILAGLQCTPIYRLKKTWKEVSGRRKKKFEDLSHLMSEEDNWKAYRVELHETMSKGTCVPFLGQFLTQILQQETAKEVMSYRRKTQGRRPQSGDLSSDNRETLSAPTTPVNSVNDNVHIVAEAVSPTDLNLDYDEQQTPTSSNTQPEVLIEEANNKEDELKYEEKEEAVKKEPSRTSIIERRDTLSPLPIGKFKKNHLPPTNVYKESFKSSLLSSVLRSPNKNSTGQQNEGDKIVENGDIASNKLNNVVCEVVKTLSLESLDSYDGASSNYSRGSTPPRDAPNVPDSEAEDIFYNNDILDVNQVELNVDDTLDTPVSDFDKETSPDIIPSTSTPTEDIIPVFTDINTDHEVHETPANTDVKQSTKDIKKKRRWSSFRRKSPLPEEISQSANNNAPCRWSSVRRKSPPPEEMSNCTNDTPHNKETSRLRQKQSSPLRSISSDNNVRKKEKGIFQRKSSPARETSPSYNDDDTPRKKEKRSLRRKLSSPLRGLSNPECNNDTPQRREKLHIYRHPDVDGFDAHNMLEQMQFSSMKYMNLLNSRPDVQSFIKGLNYNTEEDNYHISIKMEPIVQCNH